MTKKRLTGMILVIIVAASFFDGLEILFTEANHAYGQWMDPAELNEIYHNTGHSNAGFIANGNYNQTNNHK
jgi:hypothetical protein